MGCRAGDKMIEPAVFVPEGRSAEEVNVMSGATAEVVEVVAGATEDGIVRLDGIENSGTWLIADAGGTGIEPDDGVDSGPVKQGRNKMKKKLKEIE